MRNRFKAQALEAVIAPSPFCTDDGLWFVARAAVCSLFIAGAIGVAAYCYNE